CSSEGDCGSELYCYNCWIEFAGKRCVRTTVADPFKIAVKRSPGADAGRVRLPRRHLALPLKGREVLRLHGVHGDGGMSSRACRRRAESLALDSRTRLLILVNYFHTVPLRVTACVEHSLGLADVLRACHAAAGDRWANFLAVDYYKRSDGGGVFEATDMLNGMLICGRDDVRACKRTLKDVLYGLLGKAGLMPGHGGTRRT
uniref:Uncharacterized protein n=1 Tax=Aegilops tauschii subsp. strangulata TaxID=200361 RepID=A0A453B4P0_AEGTS